MTFLYATFDEETSFLLPTDNETVILKSHVAKICYQQKNIVLGDFHKILFHFFMFATPFYIEYLNWSRWFSRDLFKKSETLSHKDMIS